MNMNTKHPSNRIIIKTITKFFKNPDNTQNIADYTEREIKGSSSTIKIYQNKANKVRIPKKKLDNATSPRKSK